MSLPGIDSLTAADLAHLEAKRSWVRDHYDEESRHKYETLGGKLRLIDTILRSGWIERSETVKLQSLGVAFGDALADELGLRWMAIEDEHGRDPCLVLLGTSIRLFPMTSVSKRVESGEDVDVYELFRAACETVRRLRTEAD